MQPIRPRESVILAEDFEALVRWYQDALGFQVKRLFNEDYHFANLVTESGIRIGIASAQEMGVQPVDRSKNTVLLQFEVDDLPAFFEHLTESGAKQTFGPSFDEKGRFWYGGFSDPEGNPWWAVDRDCPQ
ncbi:MAG: VOC family protein [Planctomycetes bacterium]|nr:VOC family protein [Planctomycetota bacterium]